MTRTINILGRLSVAMAVSLTVGCEPPPPKPQDLGRIVFNAGAVPGAEGPYALPEYLRNIKSKNTMEGRPPGK